LIGEGPSDFYMGVGVDLVQIPDFVMFFWDVFKCECWSSCHGVKISRFYELLKKIPIKTLQYKQKVSETTIKRNYSGIGSFFIIKETSSF